MAKKRRPPIAKTLIKNSRAAIFSAIEIHNKPIFQYRYEIVVLLFINAWELLLKAYIHKFLKRVKLFDKTGISKPFPDCLKCVISNLDKEHLAIKENLEILYKYRNEVAHFHIEDLYIVVFSLLRKNLNFYKKFLDEHFAIDITKESDLILLPIGFKKFYSPLDFLSNESAIIDSSNYTKKFVSSLIESTVKLTEVGVEESIFVEFNMNLTNERRIKNADIIAGINNEKDTGINIILNNIIQRPIPSEEPKAALVKSMSYTISPKTDQEEIASWIALKGKEPNFKPSESELWRIYANRESLEIKDKQLLELVKFTLKRLVPVFFWLKDIKNNELKILLSESISEVKDFFLKSNILNISAFLGKGFYSKILAKFSKEEFKRLSPKSQKFPSSGPRELFQEKVIEYKKSAMKFKSDKEFKQKLVEELDEISTRLGKGESGAYDKYHAISIDCFLYARDDLYK